MTTKRRKYVDHPDVATAADTSWTESKATWADPNNPTPDEHNAAKDKRLKDCIAAQDVLVAAE